MACSIINTLTDHNALTRTILYSDKTLVNYIYASELFESKFNSIYYFLHGKCDIVKFREYLKDFEITKN